MDRRSSDSIDAHPLLLLDDSSDPEFACPSSPSSFHFHHHHPSQRRALIPTLYRRARRRPLNSLLVGACSLLALFGVCTLWLRTARAVPTYPVQVTCRSPPAFQYDLSHTPQPANESTQISSPDVDDSWWSAPPFRPAWPLDTTSVSLASLDSAYEDLGTLDLRLYRDQLAGFIREYFPQRDSDEDDPASLVSVMKAFLTPDWGSEDAVEEPSSSSSNERRAEATTTTTSTTTAEPDKTPPKLRRCPPFPNQIFQTGKRPLPKQTELLPRSIRSWHALAPPMEMCVNGNGDETVKPVFVVREGSEDLPTETVDSELVEQRVENNDTSIDRGWSYQYFDDRRAMDWVVDRFRVPTGDGEGAVLESFKWFVKDRPVMSADLWRYLILASEGSSLFLSPSHEMLMLGCWGAQAVFTAMRIPRVTDLRRCGETMTTTTMGSVEGM
jgi:hypothetical protein